MDLGPESGSLSNSQKFWRSGGGATGGLIAMAQRYGERDATSADVRRCNAHCDATGRMESDESRSATRMGVQEGVCWEL